MGSSKEAVKFFFDNLAGSYHKDRYGGKNDLCSFEMISRKEAVLEFLDRSGMRGGKLLDAGCGSAVMINEFLARGFEVWGIDISNEMVEEARKTAVSQKAHFAVDDIENLDFPDASFDVFAAIGVLDYLTTDEKALAEIKRVLKPGGVAILSVSNKFSPVYFLRKNFLPFMRLVFGRNKGKVYLANFSTREHDPWQFDGQLDKFGFNKLASKFVGSSMIPFNIKLPKICFSFAEKAAHITGKLPLGSGYVVMARNENEGK